MTIRSKVTPTTKEFAEGVYRSRWDDGAWSIQSTTQRVTSHVESYMIGEDIPNYTRRRNAGELMPMTNFEKFELDFKAPSGYYRWTVNELSDKEHVNYSIDDTHIRNDPVGLIPTKEHLEELIPDDLSHLAQAAAAKINGKGFDVLTTVAEYASTVALLRNIGVKFNRQFFRYVKRDGKLNWKKISDDWLELRYGWRPIYYDIVELVEVLSSLKEFERTRFSERVGHDGLSDSSSNGYVDTTSDGRKYNVNWQDTKDVSVRGSVVADIEVDAFQSNLIATGYEVLPFSFVLDWLINIGQSIQAASFLFGVKKYTASVGFSVVWARNCELKSIGTAAQTDSFEALCHTMAVVSLERRVPVSVSLTPHIRFGLDILNVADVLAILRQFWKR